MKSFSSGYGESSTSSTSSTSRTTTSIRELHFDIDWSQPLSLPERYTSRRTVLSQKAQTPESSACMPILNANTHSQPQFRDRTFEVDQRPTASSFVGSNDVVDVETDKAAPILSVFDDDGLENELHSDSSNSEHILEPPVLMMMPPTKESPAISPKRPKFADVSNFFRYEPQQLQDLHKTTPVQQHAMAGPSKMMPRLDREDFVDYEQSTSSPVVSISEADVRAVDRSDVLTKSLFNVDQNDTSSSSSVSAERAADQDDWSWSDLDDLDVSDEQLAQCSISDSSEELIQPTKRIRKPKKVFDPTPVSEPQKKPDPAQSAVVRRMTASKAPRSRAKKRLRQPSESEKNEAKRRLTTVCLGDTYTPIKGISKYPAAINRNRIVYVCPNCFAYYDKEGSCNSHQARCCKKKLTPPGEVIYRDDQNDLIVVEVNGRDPNATKYCIRLCLLVKLFLADKVVYKEHEVVDFRFYVLAQKRNDDHFVPIGCFSKERPFFERDNNLSCICVLPAYQRSGFGRFLIDLSFHITRMENTVGGPETPLSSSGEKSYAAYYLSEVLTHVARRYYNKNVFHFSIKEVSMELGIRASDVLRTLSSNSFIGKIDPRNSDQWCGKQGPNRAWNEMLRKLTEKRDSSRMITEENFAQTFSARKLRIRRKNELMSEKKYLSHCV